MSVDLLAIGLSALAAGAIARAGEIDILARTIWGEARGEGVAGMAAVANVVINRVKDPRWPSTVRGVVMQPRQFSAWDDVNRAAMLAATPETPGFADALAVAAAALSGGLPDTVSGANHYHSAAILPSWARTMLPVGQIGRHVFYQA